MIVTTTDGAVTRARNQLRVPLVRNAYSLVGSTILTAGLGVIFWIVAARTYSKADVGLGAALISTMVLLSNVAQLNFTTAFNRFVPTAGSVARRLVLLGYAITVALAAAVATIFIVGTHLGLWTPKLRMLLDQHGNAFWFVAATMIWTVFALEDAVLTGLGEAHWVLVENTLYGILKLAVLVAIASSLPHSGIFVSWTAPVLACVIGVNWLVITRLIPARAGPPSEPIDAASVRRFVSIDYVNSLMWTAANGLIPLMVLSVAGRAATAYAYLAYTIAYTLYLVSLNVGMSMITEVAQAPERLVEYARKTIAHSLSIVAPLALGLCLAAPWVLAIFGKGYADHATHLLQLLALSSIPAVFVSTYLSMMRATRRMLVVLIVTFVQSAATLVLMAVLLRTMGITGVGVAWLAVQTTLGLFLLLGELRALWLPSLRRDSPLAIARRAPRPGSGPDGNLEEIGRETLESSGLASRGWALDDLNLHGDDVCMLGVRSTVSGDRGILKVATSDAGPEVLRQGRIALQAVRGCAPLQLADILPRVLDVDGSRAPTWTLETRCPGLDARTAPEHPDALCDLILDITERMCTLYRVRATVITVDDGLFARLVDKPLSTTEFLRSNQLRSPAHAKGLAKLRAELHAELVGRELTMSLTHGDLWLGNVLWDPERGRVTGIVDWHRATVDQPVVDIAHLTCSTRALVERREFGAVVCDALGVGVLPAHDEEMMQLLPGAGDLTPRTAMLLAWLRHVSDNRLRTSRSRAHGIWLERNVYQVLETV